jgi:hypothetical protein
MSFYIGLEALGGDCGVAAGTGRTQKRVVFGL